MSAISDEALTEALAALAKHNVTLSLTEVRRALRGHAATTHVTDVVLAWACLQRNEPAIGYFERAYFAQATRALKRMRISATLTDDVLGWLRFELFAREDGALIGTYSGRGDLGSWVRSIAVHEALKRAKRERRDVTPDAAADLPMPEPELVAMRGAFGPQFTAALAESFAALSTQQRNLLRQSFLDGLSIDVLAGLYKVHRATAARRVAAARAELVQQVRVRLARELALSETGVDQVITLSNLNESLGQMLRKTRG